MKIRNRFILLYSLLFVAFIAIGSFTYFSFQKVKNLNRIDKNIHQLYTNALELRKLESDYLLWEQINPNYFKTGESGVLANFDSTYSKTKEICNLLITERFVHKIKVNQNIQSIQDALENYNQSFIIIEKNKFEFGFKDWGMTGDMRKAIHTVEKKLEEMKAPKLQVHMLMLRRHEKDYQLRRDISYREKFESELTKFREAIEVSGYSTQDKTYFWELLSVYQNTFVKLIEKDQLIGITQTSGLTANVQNNAQHALNLIYDLNEKISRDTKQYIHSAIVELVLFILICSAITIGIAMFISKRMVVLMGGEPEEVALITNNIAKGNLQFTFDDTKEYSGMMKSVVIMASKLTEILTAIYKNIDQVTMASQQFASTSQHISQGVYEQSTTIDEISSTMDLMRDKAVSNADNAIRTETISTDVKRGIEMVQKQSELSLQTSRVIAGKTKTINNITTQTKILALNAAVEAARAGEHGSGFHVIAEEVKRLAEMTNEASMEITSLTNENLSEAENVSNLIHQILVPIDTTTVLVKEISNSSQEQSSGAHQISYNIQQLHQISQDNAASSEELAASAEELERQSKELQDLIAYFSIGDVHTADGRVLRIYSEKNKKKKKKKTSEMKKTVKLWKKQMQSEKIRV